MTRAATNKKLIERYSRQLIIPELGLQGQEMLMQAKVLVVGAGGLGCPVLMYLAAAGIGCIGIADYDTVDLSNLQRQILFYEKDEGISKVDSASNKLMAMNSNLTINKIYDPLSIDNVLELVGQYDVIIDASDNFLTRYLLNDACHINRKPLISGSVFRFEGQVSIFNTTEHSPCYRCLYPSPPPQAMVPNCSAGGAIGAVAGIIGTIQATECIKIIIGKGDNLSGKLMSINMLDLDIALLDVKKSETCSLCSEAKLTGPLQPKWYEFENHTQFCSKVKSISSMNFHKIIKNKEVIKLISVKEDWEQSPTRSGIDHASMPLSRIEKNPTEILDKLLSHGKNIFYCEDGSRSDYAVNLIEREFGFENLYSYSGNPYEVITSSYEEN